MVGKLYASDTPKLAETRFHNLPFSDGKLDYKSNEANTFSFKTNQSLPHGTRIRYEDPRGKEYGFGGQIYNTKETITGLYEYDCVSYLRLYLSKIGSVAYNDNTSYNILKKIIKKDPNNLSIAGLTKTTNKHSYLKWEKKSIWEIARQLQYLEWKAGNPVECYVDLDGVLHFGKNINKEQGYKFSTTGDGTNMIIDYDDEYSTDDVVTVGRVLYSGATKSSATASKNMIATWGYIEGDSFDCTENITQTNTSSTNTANTNTDGAAFIQKYNINSKIVKQAQSIVGSAKSDKAKAKAIFNWMRNHIQYKRYACTKKGALGTLNARTGNCADQTHLYMSLAGSVGLTVRCNHINGHFFPETKLNGKWFPTDTVTSRGWGGHACSGAHWAYHYNPNQFNC